MYDIRPLEEEWKKYKKKKRKPWYIAGISVLALFILIVLFSNSSRLSLNILDKYINAFKNRISNSEDVSHRAQEFQSKFVMNTPLRSIEVEKQVSIEAHDVKENNVEETPANILVDIPILDGKEHVSAKNVRKKRSKIHLDIIKTTNVTAYKDVENRFKQSHDVDDSLFLARSYYKKGNYKKSEYWALQTNKINSNIEESMLIFVKSKMKLGRKNEARNILKKYMRISNSQEAKKLLYRIENGKF